ncbi:MAG: hypothetical protein ABR981_04335 [Candidatus Micrarchaeaceae archaeon]
MKKLAKELITSFVTVILGILAVALFIYSGSSLVFYVVVVMTMIIGFYNAWLISLTEDTITKKAGSRRASGRS